MTDFEQRNSPQTPREIMNTFRNISSNLDILAKAHPDLDESLHTFAYGLGVEIRMGISDEGGRFENVAIGVPESIRFWVEQELADTRRPKIADSRGFIYQETRIRGLFFLSQKGQTPEQRISSVVGANCLPKLT